MRLYQILSVFLFLVAGQAAEEATIETAIVAEGKINVRGKPSLIGEVITQLEQGEKVTVLERITNSTPRPGDSTNWAKIKLPPNTPVWVFAPFVKEGVVAVSRLNVRAGRGENYSVIGRINRDHPVKHIRTVEEWMEIEPPTNAYAFVDLDLLQFEGEPPRVRTTTPPPIEVAQPATPTPTTPEVKPEPVTPSAVVTAEPTPPPEIPTNTTETVAAIPTTPEQAPATAPPEPATAETPAVATPPVAIEPEPVVAQTEAPPTNSVAAVQIPAPTTTPETLPQIAPPLEKRSEPPPRRVVRREGIVRATTSIQAPTWYELANAETKKRINYLFDENLGLNLKDYRGQRVVVSGEEAIDPRWPNTPILDMQTLDVLPDATR
jgi:hypothetical protein